MGAVDEAFFINAISTMYADDSNKNDDIIFTITLEDGPGKLAKDNGIIGEFSGHTGNRSLGQGTRRSICKHALYARPP
jgi:type V secretory pathway adhesin AidA